MLFYKIRRRGRNFVEKPYWVKIFRSVESGKSVYFQRRISIQQRVWIDDHDVKLSYC